MFTLYVLVTLAAAGANAFSATLDFAGDKKILEAMREISVPESWIYTLGTLKAMGAIGLLVGMGLAPIGIVAGLGLVLFFIAAIIAHLRVRNYDFGPAFVFLLLSVAALGLRLALS